MIKKILKKEETTTRRSNIVFLKEKMNMDQFLKENATKAVGRLSELAKKAETKESKKADYIVKVKKNNCILNN